jgi:hypothetical protein
MIYAVAACKSYYLEEIEFGVLPFCAPSNGALPYYYPSKAYTTLVCCTGRWGPPSRNSTGLWAHVHRVRGTGRGKKREYSGVKFRDVAGGVTAWEEASRKEVESRSR